MSYQVLARKYRPQRFSQVIGQEHVTRTLTNALEQGRTAHGYIFSGHRGIGKTTVARILAMALNCRSSEKPVAEPCGVCDSCTEIRAGNSVDVIEIDAATNRGIDEIRELREAARYRPARDRFKIYILDEAHQITDAAFNALLKTLEEPPGHVVFMLATTQPEDIPQTIRSRCQLFSFRAVKFQEILGQLKDLASREMVASDEDALALLAEAGDGSVRDALSILDQAIASSDGRLTAEQVRQLVGAAPSGILVEVMQSVAKGSAEGVLHEVDRLLGEGNSPAHFARQMVRFLRNAIVAKVAGSDSSLLQISSDERQRVAAIAELFSEEDLTRHLQIMLRTHAELGYRQEQRFHLELGLLKMVHAQRLLPIEQLLSDAAPGGVPRPVGRSSAVGEKRRPDSPSERSNVSPFAADAARKGGFKTELSSDSGPQTGSRPGIEPVRPSVVMGTAAPARLAPDSEIAPDYSKTLADQPNAEDPLQRAVLSALTSSGRQMLASLLAGGQWQVAENELVIRVAASENMIDMSLDAAARRLVTAAAGEALGRPAKFKVVSAGSSPSGSNAGTPINGSGRTRAEHDPVVRRMKEKFGAEIRTIIDYRKKG